MPDQRGAHRPSVDLSAPWGFATVESPAPRAARDLGLAAGWRLVALLCLGYPGEEHDDPGLERAGREPREGMGERVTTV